MTMLAFGAFRSIFLSWLLSGWLRHYVLSSRHLIDLPNERCSHTMPPPRGGGVAIVVSFLLLVAVLGAWGFIEPRLAVAILGAGLLVATLGFMDDRSSLPARWRFLGHAAAAAWVLCWMDHISQVPVFGTLIDLSYAGPVLCGPYLVWTMNLINFIDGIARVQAITTTLGGAVLWWLLGVGTSWLVTVLFVGCVGGFLVAFIEHGQLKRKMGSRA